MMMMKYVVDNNDDDIDDNGSGYNSLHVQRIPYQVHNSVMSISA